MNIKDYFSFTRGEKRGTLVLLLIIITLIVVNFSIDFFKSTHQTDLTEFDAAINKFEKELHAENNTLTVELFKFNPNTISDKEWIRLGFKNWQIKTINNYKSKGGKWKTKTDVSKIYGLKETHFNQLKPFILLPDKIETEFSSKNKIKKRNYFNFNPNTISDEEWKKLGFEKWQITSINNYKSKGGKWKIKTDVAKIYGLDENDYNKLAPYILLLDKIEKKEHSTKKDFNKKVNINTANAIELTNLKGIYSEKYTKIIIKYRKNLGGFITKEQLKEVWNMDNETYNGFQHQVVLGNQKPKQFNINTATTNELKNHPYIDWKIANAIVKYREANNNYKKIKDIKKIHIIRNETYMKIAPYLSVK